MTLYHGLDKLQKRSQESRFFRLTSSHGVGRLFLAAKHDDDGSSSHSSSSHLSIFRHVAIIIIIIIAEVEVFASSVSSPLRTTTTAYPFAVLGFRCFEKVVLIPFHWTRHCGASIGGLMWHCSAVSLAVVSPFVIA
jgi:hypothetical protein